MTDYPDYICAPCGKRYGRGMPEGHLPTYHVGRCGIYGQDGVEVTEPRDWGHLDWEKVKREKGEG
jgi:hypothetical protein